MTQDYRKRLLAAKRMLPALRSLIPMMTSAGDVSREEGRALFDALRSFKGHVDAAFRLIESERRVAGELDRMERKGLTGKRGRPAARSWLEEFRIALDLQRRDSGTTLAELIAEIERRGVKIKSRSALRSRLRQAVKHGSLKPFPARRTKPPGNAPR
jgi:transposase